MSSAVPVTTCHGCGNTTLCVPLTIIHHTTINTASTANGAIDDLNLPIICPPVSAPAVNTSETLGRATPSVPLHFQDMDPRSLSSGHSNARCTHTDNWPPHQTVAENSAPASSTLDRKSTSHHPGS